jgi:hypothetical protein
MTEYQFAHRARYAFWAGCIVLGLWWLSIMTYHWFGGQLPQSGALTFYMFGWVFGFAYPSACAEEEYEDDEDIDDDEEEPLSPL